MRPVRFDMNVRQAQKLTIILEPNADELER